MKLRLLISAAALAGLMACSDDNSGSSTSGSTGTTATTGGSTTGGSTSGSSGTSGSTGSTGTPQAPTLGAQIDRMGRPAINTALTNPFDTVSGKTSDQVKDEYNASADPSQWGTAFGSYIAHNLAILDGLDRNCGNQVFAKPANGGTIPADRYATLAGVLANDQLFVNTGSTSCAVYLGVEANATGLIANSDCGGRTPLEDTIDESYSLLAAGAVSGVTDGIGSDADGTASLSAFPYLDGPGK